MNFPKKVYREKVKQRLEIVKEIFSDKEDLKKFLARKPFQGKSDVHNKIEQLEMLLNQDLPFILNLLDEIANAKTPNS